jgi:TPR repeat protein
MGAPIRESDDSEPPRGELLKNAPSRIDPLRDASQRTSTAPLDRTPDSVDPPRILRAQRGVFEGDVAAVELRSRLARTGAETAPPAVRRSPDRQFAAGLRRTGFLFIAAAAAGVAGYLLGGFGLRDRLPPADPPPAKSPPMSLGETNVAQAPLTPAANLKAPGRDTRLPAAQTAAVDLAPAEARRAAGQGEAAQPLAPALQNAPPSASSPPSSPPSVQDPAEIAAKMKIGADLIASGDIAAARTMFERVAEAGEAAGAFALAETYDPAVLRALRLRGGIKADPALAQRWYEKAREMGSAAAAERIARLTQNPGR